MRLTDETYSCYLTLSLKRGLPEVRGAPQSGEGMSSRYMTKMTQTVCGKGSIPGTYEANCQKIPGINEIIYKRVALPREHRDSGEREN